MTSSTREAQIQKLQTISDQTHSALQKLQDAFEVWEKQIPAFQQLMNYYGSEERNKDRERSASKPFDFPHGILSEDEVYNLYQEQREIALAMLRAAVKILE